mgnify:CR=1 FL=1
MSSKILEKYNYRIFTTNKVDNLRYYCLSEDLNVPSVTSIIRSTKADYYRETPNKITTPMEIGDMMHKYLQQYLTEMSTPIIKTSNSFLAESLAQIVIDNLISKLDEIWGSEVSVYYTDKYAGTIDLIGIYDGKICVIDYKSSYKTKTIDELEDFFIQCAAYAIAHDWQYNTNIDSIMIFQVTRDGNFEQNIMHSNDMEIYKRKWFNKLELFYSELSVNGNQS